jgi:hypothetical protein
MHKIRNFHGQSTIGEWQGSGRETAWEQHGMCESTFTHPSLCNTQKVPSHLLNARHN